MASIVSQTIGWITTIISFALAVVVLVLLALGILAAAGIVGAVP